MMKARLTFLGTGTSLGVPIVGCDCRTCSSTDPRDKRLRASAFVEYGGLKILIDVGPDYRTQMLSAGLCSMDAILFTHDHKDHTGGFDDLRAINYVGRQVAEIWCEDIVLQSLKKAYSYIFADDKYPGVSEVSIHLIDENPFIVYPLDRSRRLEWERNTGYRYLLPSGELVPVGNPLDKAERADDPLFEGNCRGIHGNGVEIIPIRGIHGQLPVLGFRFGNIAYITDMSAIPEKEYEKLKNLDHVTINTVSYRHHHSHFSLDEALEVAARIGAGHTWLTHLSHSFPPHEEFSKELKSLCKERRIPSVVLPAYDGLILE